MDRDAFLNCGYVQSEKLTVAFDACRLHIEGDELPTIKKIMVVSNGRAITYEADWVIDGLLTRHAAALQEIERLEKELMCADMEAG